MSIAASAAAEIAERERERRRRCDAALAPLREAVARASTGSRRKRRPPTRGCGTSCRPPSTSTSTSSTSTTAGCRRRRAWCRTRCGATSAAPTRPPPTRCGRCWSRRWRSSRARLAALFGCDAEEVAITRNACESLETVLFGFDLERGDEVLTTNQDYPRTLAALRQRERREGIVVRTISFPVPPLFAGGPRDRFRAGAHPAHARPPRLAHDVPHRPDLPGGRDLPDGARGRSRGGRRRRARPGPASLPPRRPRVRLLRSHAAQVGDGPARHGVPLRAAHRRSRACGR